MENFLNSQGQEFYNIYLSKGIDYRKAYTFEDYIENLVQCECCNDYFDEEEIILTKSNECICEQCIENGYIKSPVFTGLIF